MNAHTALLTLILVLMALNACEPLAQVEAAPQALAAAVIYLHAAPHLPARLKLA